MTNHEPAAIRRSLVKSELENWHRSGATTAAFAEELDLLFDAIRHWHACRVQNECLEEGQDTLTAGIAVNNAFWDLAGWLGADAPDVVAFAAAAVDLKDKDRPRDQKGLLEKWHDYRMTSFRSYWGADLEEHWRDCQQARIRALRRQFTQQHATGAEPPLPGIHDAAFQAEIVRLFMTQPAAPPEETPIGLS